MNSINYECCIIGAGPAGLGTAIELTRGGVKDILIVDKGHKVGGLSRTDIYGGARFDIGPHRFFTRNQEINALWHNTLGADFRAVDRITRIHYKDKFFNYPIKALDVLTKLGVVESAMALGSFAASRFNGNERLESFEDWITQKFGRKLYETFFKTYTEKVWGIPCDQISAQWAAQRIKGLDVFEIIKRALSWGSRTSPKTLVERFDYPILGAGQMYEAMCEGVVARGVDVLLSTGVVSFNRRQDVVDSIDIITAEGQRQRISARHFFSSAALTHFFRLLDPKDEHLDYATVDALYYRDHITVNILLDETGVFPDQWVYIHSPDVKVARIANYNNFSPEMVRDKGMTALSAEYFVFQHESLWRLSDDEIREMAADELQHLGLIRKERVVNSWVVRETEAYPTYYINFEGAYDAVKARTDTYINFSPIGRGGLYKYNNQDHSILSGILAARNYLKLPGTPYRIWDINIDAQYHEGGKRVVL
ncbi:MAG: NAD(P)-binding protein [Nitrospirae bacterium]|uniref:NAD(P)-binding protein n=1 Tax=Candidatus Magnetobacterium casense TaxID=1455061 RepID=UPI00058EAB3D|nr:NAD(P)-binding protein [Candidatus Magnetobacterium casensis]MBF0337015.1 NAD(P)-binding protein [Nitrospirota bacterium]